MKKNLLYIFADQWRKSAIGLEGEPVETPNIDAFSKSSICFNNAISSYPLCSPHRAALFTGKYPFSCGMWTNCKIGLDEVVMLKPQETSMAHVLKDKGYQTAYVGKWHLDASELNFNDQPESGALEWDAFTPPGERRMGFDYWYSYGAMDNHLRPHYWKDTPKKIYVNQWSPEHETDIAIEYMKGADRDKPFYMVLSWNPPHPPLDQVPDRYLAKVGDLSLRENVLNDLIKDQEYLLKVKQYYAAIAGIDENFGRIIDYLRKSGLMENTVVVLSSDHGEMLGSHGLMGKNIWYEEAINIPLMIKHPDLEPQNNDLLVSSMDQMPTLLDALECPIPDTVEGDSVWPHIQEPGLDEKDNVFISMIPGMPSHVKAFYEKGMSSKAHGWRGIRTKTEVYVINNGNEPGAKQERLLYNLDRDPFQLEPEFLDSSNDKSRFFDHLLKGHLDLIGDPFLMNQNDRYQG